MAKIRLGVNLDHIVTLRQVRDRQTTYPELIYYMKEAIRGGADQITIHLREDRRHVNDKDARDIIKKSSVPVNLEMAFTNEMACFALKWKPRFVCLVPEKREELTTEGGLNVKNNTKGIGRLVEKLKKKGIGLTTFIAPSKNQIKASVLCGASAIELHTGRWVSLSGEKKRSEWKKLKEAAVMAHEMGLEVHAGHGLDTKSCRLIKKLPFLEEVNIGHFLVCDALRKGLRSSVRDIAKILNSGG